MTLYENFQPNPETPSPNESGSPTNSSGETPKMSDASSASPVVAACAASTPPATDSTAFSLDSLPEPDVQLPNWGALQIDGPLKALILPDVHVPYHDKQALILSLDYGRRNSVDLVLLNGDAVDFYELSRFNKDPRARRWIAEVEMMREFLAFLRKAFPHARIIYKKGNHDDRYDLFLQRNAPEFIGLDVFEFANVLKLADNGIELVGEKRPIRLGMLSVIHGHEYTFPISNPVNPARGLYLRAGAYALCAHFHQKSEHTQGNIEMRSITTWSTGCLCQLHPYWLPINNWSHGFAYVEVFNNGKFNLLNHKISHGKIY